MVSGTVSFIPARAGSKGVVRKNLREVGGKPLIQHSIEGALATPGAGRVVVTTDCPDTAALARSLGATLVDRPAELAADDTPTWPAIAHAVRAVEGMGIRVDLVLLLQCTCPLRRPQHIEESLALFDDQAVESVNSVMRVGDEHPARMYRIEDGRLSPLEPEWEKARRQDLPAVYRRNGVIYAQRPAAFWSRQAFMGGETAPYVMSVEDSINIDTEIDLIVADALLRRRA